MNTRPVMQKRDGALGWMASTPADHPWRITVFGASPMEARAKYREAIIRWKGLPVDREVQ